MDNNLKIQRVSGLMQLACSAYILFAPLFVLGFWMNFERFGPEVAAYQNLTIRLDYMGTLNLLLAGVSSAIPVGLIMYGVWRLRRLFGLYRTGSFFTAANAGHLHAFATTLLVSVLLGPVISVLTSFFLTMSNPPGQRSISLSLSSNTLGVLFIAGVLFAIAWIMREGHRLAAENAEFI